MLTSIIWGVGVRGVMAKVLDCKIVVSEFELQSRYYAPFRIDTLGKGLNRLLILAKS